MPQFRAAWLLPITQPPIRDAWILTDGGRIVAFGHSQPGDFTPSGEIDLGQVAVLPGLVNAHTHLELSWLRGRIEPTDDFPGWIRSVVNLTRQARDHADEVHSAISEAIDEARRCGTALVGDISNTLKTSRALAEQRLAALVFHEVIAFASENAHQTIAGAVEQRTTLPSSKTLRHSIAPHAPYSVSPALFNAIRTELARSPTARTSIHLAESQAEVEFLATGTGPWREFLEDIKAWDPAWRVPRCRPVEYMERLGFMDDRLLVVHGVQLTVAELWLIAASGATLVTCPRGNIRTGAGTPPIEDFYRHAVRVAVGTDSLASVPDLNIFSELAELRRLAPSVPPRALLESATIAGARALGFDADFGAIEAGKRDSLIAIDLPRHVQNVEEYLVSGIDASRIHWLDSSAR
jgi:cytosine/adenosine deaminase-related metal-dependent hydrolase